jgi:Cytochrome P450
MVTQLVLRQRQYLSTAQMLGKVCLNLFCKLGAFGMILNLHEKVDGSSKGRVNIVQWLNFTTFDTIRGLSFGESFDALRTGEYHNWILNLFKGIKFASMFRIIKAYPIVGTSLAFLLGRLPGVQKASQTHRAYTREKIMRRLETETMRKDFIR